MSGKMPFLACLLFWIGLSGLAPAPHAPKLAYATIDLDRAYGRRLAMAATALPQDRVAGQRTGAAAADGSRLPGEAMRPNALAWHLTVEAGVTADSNVTNSSDDRFLPLRQDGVTVPIALDPSYRAHSGTGRGGSVSAGVKLRLSDGAAIAVDADAYALDHKGGRNDDISFLLAAGPELTWSGGGSASVQLVAGKSWYGGTSTNSGFGLRGRYSTAVGPGQRISLSVDARRFESGYGRDFGGRQAGAYLSGSTVLDPDTSASLGIFARREWLRSDAYSNFEIGAYGGISRYLGSAFTGTLSAGFSRTAYDAPLLYLSDKRRQDWRLNAGIQLTTRKPIGMGVYPLLSYSYNRTDGSIDFFDADRHRVRLGVRRSF